MDDDHEASKVSLSTDRQQQQQQQQVVQNIAIHPSNTSPSIKVTNRQGTTLLTRILIVFLQYVYTPISGLLTNPAKDNSATTPPDVKIPSSTRNKFTITKESYKNWNIYNFQSKSNPTPCRRIIYLFGGSGCLPPQPQHVSLCTEVLSHRLNAIVTMIIHPLAPHHPAPEVIPDLMDCYAQLYTNHMSNSPNIPIDLAGDSSGGNLALMISQNTIHPPRVLFLLSPSLDISMGNPNIERRRRIDPLQTYPKEMEHHKIWAGSMALNNPLCSPLFNDKGFEKLKEGGTKVVLIVGTRDLYAADIRVLEDKLNKLGVEGEWLRWEGMIHCFLLMFQYKVKEAEEGAEWLVEVMNRGS